MSAPSVPFAATRFLPPYRAVLVVDAKDFTGNPSSSLAALATEIPNLVEDAFRRARLSEIWESVRFSGHTGDGVALGFSPEYLPFLVHPFLDSLQQILKARNDAATRNDALVRLRVSIHVGPLPDSGDNTVGDGNGKPRNDAHRLLDSVPVKAMLASASERVTHVAAILSQRVFEDVVEAGYAGRHPDHFIPVIANVPGKKFTEGAWLYVPEPSGNLFQEGVLGEAVVREVKEESARTNPGAGIAITTSHGQVAQTVHGGMHQSVQQHRDDR